MDDLIYPVERLLSNPRVFYAIANYLGGPDPETLKTAFYDLLEYDFSDQESPEDCEFEATEVCFAVFDGGARCEISMDNGYMSVLEAIDGEVRAAITNDNEFAASAAIYSRLVKAIEESHPPFVGDIALCSPPTPGNAYLRSEDGESFVGRFHLLTDPEKVYAFNVEVIDIQTDQLKATIKPI
jgi:hypothetical protein